MLSPYKETARTQSLLLLNAISLFYFARDISNRSKRMLQIVFCFVSSLVSLFFVSSQFFGDSFSHGREGEFFINQNIIGAFSLIAIFISLNCYSEHYRKIFLFPLVLNCLTLLYARSFGGWIAGGAAFLYLYKTNKKFVLVTVGGIAFLVIVYGILYSDWIIHRLNWWSAAGQILIHYPFFGSGPGTFSKLFCFFMDAGLKSPYAHNFYLQTASEWGIPATFLFLLFIVKILKTAPINFLTAGLLALLVHNLYDYSMNIPGIFLYFWIFLGIGSEKQRASESLLKPLPWYYRLPIVTLLLFAGWSLGIKPLLSFSSTLQAQKSLEENNLEKAKDHLKRAMEWDPLPAKIWLDYSQLVWHQYQMNKDNSSLLKEALTFQKEALRRDPFLKAFISAEKAMNNDKKR